MLRPVGFALLPPTLTAALVETSHRLDKSSSTELSLNVRVSMVRPGEEFQLEGGDVGFAFAFSRELDFDLEDAICESTKKAVLRALQSCGGVPPGGIRVQCHLEVPEGSERRVEELLPGIAARTADSVKHALREVHGEP